jgi:uncharacterized protein (DUF2141 family)
MRMAFRKALILFLPFFLAGCAQVGYITGGSTDVYAPAPKEMLPPNESINFSGNSFEITFDEFVQLKDPLQNVVIIPDHAKLKTTLHHKTVRVEWEETLKSNTTYVVYFNGAVEDVTENNDSLMTYVFSTGSQIDSISYSVRVVDAFTNQLTPKMKVGLFTEPDQNKPYYFAGTDESGIATFDYVAAGTYYLRAFEDMNNDLKMQGNEALAFRSEALKLDSSNQDTLPLRIYSPKQPAKLLSLKAVPPGALLLEANADLKGSSFQLNESPVPDANIQFTDDSKALIFTDLKTLSNASVIIENPEFTDTITARLTEREKTGKVVPTAVFYGGKIGPQEEFAYQINDLILSVDTSLLVLKDPSDSSEINIKDVKIDQNKLTVDFDRSKHKRVEITFKKGALQTKSGTVSEELGNTVELLYEKDYGVLHVDATGYAGPIVLELLKDKSVVLKRSLSETKKTDLTNVLPGDYKIRVISDDNKNGKWDEGDLQKGIQPEKVDWFTVPKVRANWEIDVSLSAGQKNE